MARHAKLLRILLVCGVTGVPAQQATRRVLWDFRTDKSEGPVKRGSEIPIKTQQQILSALFPKYQTNESACDREMENKPVDDANLEAEREAGQMVPAIEAYVDGSFTVPGSHQTAYSIKVGECLGYATPSYPGTYRLAIFEGPHLVGVYRKGGLMAAADVNNDGIDELLLGSFAFGMGEMTGVAILVSLRGGELHTIREFDDAYDNDCDATTDRPRVTASVITYTPTQLFVEQYEAPCKPHLAVPAPVDFKLVH